MRIAVEFRSEPITDDALAVMIWLIPPEPIAATHGPDLVPMLAMYPVRSWFVPAAGVTGRVKVTALEPLPVAVNVISTCRNTTSPICMYHLPLVLNVAVPPP